LCHIVNTWRKYPVILSKHFAIHRHTNHSGIDLAPSTLTHSANQQTAAIALKLGNVPWMQSLPANVRMRVASEAYQSFHPEKEVVAAKGEPAHSWIGVMDGLLQIRGVFRSGKVVMFAGIPAGSWVGEGSVLKREPRRYDIVAIRPTRAIHIPRATFWWLLETSIEFNHFILQHINERLSQYIWMVETDRYSDPVTRLARALSGLYNPVLYPSMGSIVPLSQEELGELAGLSRQSVNAAIKKLDALGFVRAAYGGLLVKDIIGLRNYESEKF
jgi:CRP/FNR family cyclic AMP-dependent transcriptional regulator